MKKITRKQLLELLLNPSVSGISGTSFIGIDMLTTPKLEGGKGNDMQGNVQKSTVGMSVMVFQNKNVNGYNEVVKRRLIAEGKNPDTFVLSPRKWGKRIDGCPVVEHLKAGDNDYTYYLEIICLNGGKSSYLLNGKPIKKELVQGLNDDREEGEQGGLSDKVIIRTPKLSSITRITINKEVYLISE